MLELLALLLLAQRFSPEMFEYVFGAATECIAWCDGWDNGLGASPTAAVSSFGCVSQSFINWMIRLVSFMWVTWIASDCIKNAQIMSTLVWNRFSWEWIWSVNYLHWLLNSRNYNTFPVFEPHQRKYDYVVFCALPLHVVCTPL